MKKIDVNYIKTEFQKIQNYFSRKDYLKVIEKTKILIKKDPRQVPFYTYLGLSYKLIGKYDLAIQILRRGLNFFPNSIAILTNLGSVYRAQNQFSKAEEYFQKAILLNPKDPSVLVNFANLKRDQNQIDQSITLYEQAYDINNNNETLLINLAGAYQIIGNFEKSKKILIELHQKFPRNTIADKIYSVIHKYAANDDHQKIMLDKINNPTFTNDEKIKLYFALAKSYSDQNNIENEVKYIIKGNEETYKSIKEYNFTNEIKKFQHIKDIFKEYPFLNNLNIDNNQSTDLIFVVGMPRSGTTLIHQIISSHSKVFGAGELSILLDFFSDKIFDNKFLKDFFNNDKNTPSLKNDIAKQLLNLFKENDKNKIILDKAPLNFFWIGFIKILFPTAKIIHANRNLQDVALSIYRNTFDGFSLPWSYNQEHLIKFIDMYQDLMKYWNDKLQDQIYLCSYENLVDNPNDEIRKLIKFCNLDWEDNCLSFNKNKTAIKTVSIAQARQPIYKSSVSLFKNYKEHFDFLNKINLG